VDEALEVVGLSTDGARPYREYSSGMRQRLSIARGLLGAPEILLMDEPTRALDPPSAHWIRRFVRDRLAKDLGTTVLVATHDLLEAETTCDALSLVEAGRIVATGTPADLKRPLDRAARTAITLLPPWHAAEAAARADAAVTSERLDDGTLQLVVPGGPDEVAERVTALAAAGARIAAVEPKDADLATLFERLAAAGRPAQGGQP
jgi:ABC-2 type transport system ATP-binding protein